MELIDTHAHLYLPEFDEDRDDMIARAMAAGVKRFYLPNIDSRSVDNMLQLEAAYPQHCFAMMGLHPCSVKENWKEELTNVKSWLERRPFVAVGEIGIDLHWDKTHIEAQRKAFLQQTLWSLDYELPIIIHCRESTDMVIDLLRDLREPRLRGIFHCFGGTLAQAEAIIELGFLLGIGGVLTFKKSGLDAVLTQIDLQHLVFETDSPYLAPTPHRGKRNESAYLRLVADKLAEVKQLPIEEIARTTTDNANRLFSKQEKAIEPSRQVI